jgi:cytochrome d ubiquinol oxidase subunit II
MARWTERPVLFLVPFVGLIAVLIVWHGARRAMDTSVFLASAALFVVAYGMFAVSFWPYIVPFSITINEAAAPMSSLSFMFWGAGLFVFPLMLAYTLCGYTVFKGKVDVTSEHY